MMAGARAVMKASSLHYAPLIQSEEKLAMWNNYSAQNYHWVDEARFHRNGGVSVEIEERPMPFVFQFSATGGPVKDGLGNGPLSPLWQYGPVSDRPMVVANYNAANNPTYKAARDVTLRTKKAVLSTQDFFGIDSNADTDPPSSMLLQPVINGFQHETNASIVAHLIAIIPWSEFFSNVSWQGSDTAAHSLFIRCWERVKKHLSLSKAANPTAPSRSLVVKPFSLVWVISMTASFGTLASLASLSTARILTAKWLDSSTKCMFSRPNL